MNVVRAIPRPLAAFACGAAVAWTAVAGAEASVDKPPNIVFIFSDDHSLQTIGAYGARLSEFCREQNITPNIDRLAAEGGLFVNSFCGNSICSPSRASVLTGLHSHANGVRTIVGQPPIPPTMWTFPQALHEAGYQTSLIGKWHLEKTVPTYDEWLILPGQGQYTNPDFRSATGKITTEGYASDVITDLAIDWLKKRDPAKPFFLAIQHKAPHREFVPPPRYYSWLDGVKIPEPETLFDDYSTRTSAAREQKLSIEKEMELGHDLKVGPKYARHPGYAARNAEFARLKPEGRALTQWKYQQYMKDYLRCVKGVDDSVGRILEELKKEGLEDNTIVIYSSDQGFLNGEHGWFDKRWIYEESIHMPFIVRWPGVVKPGTRFTEFIQNIDYAETFVDMAGGKIPEGLHGRSLVPVLRGATPADWRKSVYYHFYKDPTGNVAKHCGVRTDRYTLAYFYEKNEWELFDNQKDPQQIHNVHDNPEYAKIAGELKSELTRLRSLYKDSDDLSCPTNQQPP